MTTSERKSSAAEAAERQPPASDAPAGAEAGQGQGSTDTGANTQGSPAAPAMKQFAKTEAESRGRG